MVLAADVQDRQGRILLKSGVELSEKHIRMLETWGITMIEIQGEQAEAKPMDKFSEQEISEAQGLADQRFQTSNQAMPVIQHLKTLWIQRYLINKASAG